MATTTPAPLQLPNPSWTAAANGPKNERKAAAPPERPPGSSIHTEHVWPRRSSPRTRPAIETWPPLPRRNPGTTNATSLAAVAASATGPSRSSAAQAAYCAIGSSGTR